MDVEKLKAILAVLEGTEVSRLDWTDGAESIRIQLGHPPAAQAVQHHSHASSSQPQQAPAPAPAAVAAASPAPAAKIEVKGFTVNSPFVGTFYRAASPDAPPLVEPGTVIRKGQVLCIVEAMKLMNEIEADTAGRVVEVLVQNGSPVEYGEPLFRLEPV
jgi:acetyl-CoA carboxylase biotin carboxyl carrier protein